MRTLLAAPLTAGWIEIRGEEAHHGRTVLRLAQGDQVRLADGAGQAASGVVAQVARDRLMVHCADPQPVADPPAIHLTIAAAAPKGDRLADLVRMLSELGVGRYIPLLTERGERDQVNAERLDRIAREALKQSRRGRLLAIDPPRQLAELGGALVVCDPAGAPARPGPMSEITVVIGPEGGLTAAELAGLSARGAMAVRLGGNILRIETAAAAAAAVWGTAWEARHHV
ncbi:ribosomal RNA small subunit methyltransferase E [Planctomycetota bacterium]|nr:ribosomal RNA small subunit methyltransferase E [Planctomycetota bacterium]